MKNDDLNQLIEDHGHGSASRMFDRRVVIGGSLAAVAGTGWFGANVLADDDDDDDNSGHGGNDDRDDDHSGSGHGGEDDHDGDDNDDDDHGGDPRQQPATVGVTEVQIIDEVFVPNHVRIETGQTVTWVNLDDDDHTASGRGMDSGTIVPGASGEVQFLEPGEFDYTCNFHPEMRGLVVVTGESLATPDASPVSLPMSAEIDIVDFGFESDDVVVAVGAVVTWTNTGAVPHTVTGDFVDSGVLDAGDTFAFTFEETGTFDYFCAIHPGMTGTIDVREQSSATPVAEAFTEVAIVDFGFDPADVAVKVRGTVTWTNTGAMPHSVTGEFADSGILDPGGIFAFTFEEAGTFEYACVLHPNMVGMVTVVE